MSLYCSGVWDPAIPLNTWLEVKVRVSVGACYLFNQGGALKKKDWGCCMSAP